MFDIRRHLDQFCIQPADVHHPLQQPDPHQPAGHAGGGEVYTGALHQLGAKSLCSKFVFFTNTIHRLNFSLSCFVFSTGCGDVLFRDGHRSHGSNIQS